MSRKERDRLTIMTRVKQKVLTLVVAAGLLGLSYRQAKRVWRRYQVQGDAGLVHRSRGRPSARGTAAAVREGILARYDQRYGDFGPTLAAEYLAREDGLVVDHETLRRWLIAAGKRVVRRRRELAFGSPSPPLAPPPRIDGAITPAVEREKGTFSRELTRGHF